MGVCAPGRDGLLRGTEHRVNKYPCASCNGRWGLVLCVPFNMLPNLSGLTLYGEPARPEPDIGAPYPEWQALKAHRFGFENNGGIGQEDWPPIGVPAGVPIERWRTLEFADLVFDGATGDTLFMPKLMNSGFGDTEGKLPFVTPYYLVDGSNIAFSKFDGKPLDVQDRERLNQALRQSIRNMNGAKLPVVIIFTHDALPKSQEAWRALQEVLSYLVTPTEGSAANVYMLAVDIVPCLRPRDDKCLVRYGVRNKRQQEGYDERNADRCRYKTQNPDPDTNLTEYGYYKMQADKDGELSHVACEYDDLVLSLIFFYGSQYTDQPARLIAENTEIVSNDKTVLKSPGLCNAMLKEIGKMNVPNVDAGVDNDFSNNIVNFRTQWYRWHQKPAENLERTRFLQLDKPEPRTLIPLVNRWGVRPKDERPRETEAYTKWKKKVYPQLFAASDGGGSSSSELAAVS